MLKRYLEAGQIVATHGTRGEVRIQPWCDSPEFLTEFEGLYLDKGERYIELEEARAHKSMVIAKFKGVESIETAVSLLRQIVYIDREWVELEEGSYFEQDLIGLEVVDAQTGKVYGKLTEVSRTGANDVYHLRTAAGETLIPAIQDVVKEVDIEGGVMKITPLKGLFDDED